MRCLRAARKRSTRSERVTPTGTDLFSKFDGLIAMREGLLSTGQEDPFNLVM